MPKPKTEHQLYTEHEKKVKSRKARYNKQRGTPNMLKSKDPVFLSYEQRVLHRQDYYEKLKKSPRSELRAIRAYRKELLLQLGAVNVSIEALNRMIRRAKARK